MREPATSRTRGECGYLRRYSGDEHGVQRMATAAEQVVKESRTIGGAPKSLVPQPCVLVIFGGDGDLSWRKLLPAIYNLNVAGVLPSHFAVVCFGLPGSGEAPSAPDDYIRGRARDGVAHFSRQALDEGHWDDYARALFYVPGSFNDSRAYAQLKAKLEAIDQQFGIPASRVYYLAVPPQVVG